MHSAPGCEPLQCGRALRLDRLLIERVKGALKVAVKDRPETKETVPDKQFNESICRAAREYCARRFDERTGLRRDEADVRPAGAA